MYSKEDYQLIFSDFDPTANNSKLLNQESDSNPAAQLQWPGSHPNDITIPRKLARKSLQKIISVMFMKV